MLVKKSMISPLRKLTRSMAPSGEFLDDKIYILFRLANSDSEHHQFLIPENVDAPIDPTMKSLLQLTFAGARFFN